MWSNADCSRADARSVQGADTWGHNVGSLTGARNTWQTISCGNHTELRVGTSYQQYTFTQCEKVCERGGGTLVRVTKNNTGCLGPDLEALLGGAGAVLGVSGAFVGLYETDEGAPCR